MHRSVKLVLLFWAFGIFGRADAQARPWCGFELLLSVQVQEDGLLLEVSSHHTYWGRNCWRQNPASLDLYRRSLGYSCGTFERLNEEPLPWSWDVSVFPEGGSIGFQYLDESAQPGVLYEYELRPVDAQRNVMTANGIASLGAVSHGEALIGHGQITRGDCPCGYSCQTAHPDYQPCLGECFPEIYKPSVLDEVMSHAGTGQSLRLFGRLSTGVQCVNWGIASYATVTRVKLSTCLVGVTESTWSATKRLYRD